MKFKVYQDYCDVKYYLTVKAWPSQVNQSSLTRWGKINEAAIYDSKTPLGREWLNGYLFCGRNMNIELLDGTRWIHPDYRQGAK